MKDMKTVVLEPSTNTHSMSATDIKVVDHKNGCVELDVKNEGIVTHGEHGTLVTENEVVLKYVQQEVNPVTRKLQNAFD